MKTAKNEKEAWDIQETYEGQPHGWIQWKGTDVCMDIHCECGAHLHIDASFTYHIKCPYCSSVYMCNGHIEFIKLEEEPTNCVVTPQKEKDDFDDGFIDDGEFTRAEWIEMVNRIENDPDNQIRKKS